MDKFESATIPQIIQQMRQQADELDGVGVHYVPPPQTVLRNYAKKFEEAYDAEKRGNEAKHLNECIVVRQEADEEYRPQLAEMRNALRVVRWMFDKYIVKPKDGHYPKGPCGSCEIPPIDFAITGEIVTHALGLRKEGISELSGKKLAEIVKEPLEKEE